MALPMTPPGELERAREMLKAACEAEGCTFFVDLETGELEPTGKAALRAIIAALADGSEREALAQSDERAAAWLRERAVLGVKSSFAHRALMDAADAISRGDHLSPDHPPRTEAEESDDLCDDCPPAGYPTDKTRCLPCPRRVEAVQDELPTAEDVRGILGPPPAAQPGVEELSKFVPCPMCGQYSHSLGEDQLAAAFMHFETIISRDDGRPLGPIFDEQTRDAAQVLMAAARSPTSPEAAQSEFCDCFGDSGLHASTFTNADQQTCCDMCGRPIRPRPEAVGVEEANAILARVAWANGCREQTRDEIMAGERLDLIRVKASDAVEAIEAARGPNLKLTGGQ